VAFAVVLGVLFWTVLGACGIAWPNGKPILNYCDAQARVAAADHRARTAELERRLHALRLRLGGLRACGPAECEPGTATAGGPADIYFLQDLSGSFKDDLKHVQATVRDMIDAARAGGGRSQLIGLGGFIDKPLEPFGVSGTYTFRNFQTLTNSADKIESAFKQMRVMDGEDPPEAQMEALLEVALRARELGFRPDRPGFVVLTTDAPPHVAGDWSDAPRAEDGVADGDAENEDYPSLAQVRAALETSGLRVVFAVTTSMRSVYARISEELGTGVVVDLARDSGNLLEATRQGIDDACGKS
jgi:hypothetical protein